MTTELANPDLDATRRPGRTRLHSDRWPDTAARSERAGPRHAGRIFGVRTGQLVSTQVTAVLLLIGAVHGTLTLAAAAVPAATALLATWLRWRGRWGFEWFGIAVRYAGRRHTAPLLKAVAPGVRVEQTKLAGHRAAVLVDGYGLTAVLELGDPNGLLAAATTLPCPAALLPPAGPDSPACRIQLLLTGVPAPAVSTGNGPPQTSYRQLAGDGALGHSRALLSIRVAHAGGWSTAETLRALSRLVRNVLRRLDTVCARPLGAAATVRALAELAHAAGTVPADDTRPAAQTDEARPAGQTSTPAPTAQTDDTRPAGPARTPVPVAQADETSTVARSRDALSAERAEESWSAVRVGGFVQATFRLERPPGRPEETSRLVSRLLSLPTAATSVALTAASRPERGRAATAFDFTVRLAAPDAAALAAATQRLGRAVSAEQAVARRLDGEHLDGLAATLPLGGGAGVDVPGRAPDARPGAGAADVAELSIGPAGLMVGRNRGGDPVVARFFRPEGTRVLLVGGTRCAQLLTLRAMALGARVVVRTARPQAWERFARGASVPGDSIVVAPSASAVRVSPGSALRPVLVVVDVGAVGVDAGSGAAWQATLVVRDEFGASDVDVAARADLLVLQSLHADEADLLGAAVGLGEIGPWLTQLRADMIGLVNRHAVRWAALAQTSVEAQLVGPPARG